MCRSCVAANDGKVNTVQVWNYSVVFREDLQKSTTYNILSKQYVGLTSHTLHKRFNTHTHTFNINNVRGDAVAKHYFFLEHTISHAKITPIDQLLTAHMIGLQNKETFWIHTLQTQEPLGININDQATFPITQIHNHT